MIQRQLAKKVTNPGSTHNQIDDKSFLKFVATSVLTLVSSEHPELGSTNVRLQLKHSQGPNPNHFVIAASSADGKRLGEYEAQGSPLLHPKYFSEPCLWER